jgi:hypothetical protein
VDVFDFDEEKNLAVVSSADDCIGCFSCQYVCPSQCIDIADVEVIKPFHRIEENVALVEQFLQTKTAARSLTGEELDIAYYEVSILISAFAEAITEILGRGHKSVGRRAGTVAAAHLPEMYEEKTLNDLLERMSKRFDKSFDFNYSITDEKTVTLSISPCGLLKAVQNSGGTPGESDICLLFHEYWAGLISKFTGSKYSYNVEKAGEECMFKLEPQA